MIQQAIDFRDESEALHALLAPLSDRDCLQVTQFKAWTLDDVIGHLHIWNHAAHLSLTDEEAFMRFLEPAYQAVAAGKVRAFERDWLAGRAGASLRKQWRELYLSLAEDFAAADPRRRLKWAGPKMSVRSAITARLMETWAHGQAAYDLLGIARRESDRIRNIVILGINTFAWSFSNRSLPVPEGVPAVRLTAPSGEQWEWNADNDTDCIEGSAAEFCQVVTQTRHIADTGLNVSGETAQRWMSIAQCFAGPPEDPPAPGTRFRV